jgi:predicted lactoylglutathione lyase
VLGPNRAWADPSAASQWWAGAEITAGKTLRNHQQCPVRATEPDGYIWEVMWMDRAAIALKAAR